jgi:hypothetical protein
VAIYANILPAAIVVPRYVGTPAASGVNHLIAAPAAGHSICVTSFVLQSSGTVNVNFQDTSAVVLGTTFIFNAREGINRQARDGDFLFAVAAGKGLDLNLSGAIAVAVEVEYVIT